MALNANLNARGTRKHTGICIDSGATITLLKKSRWLQRLLTRLTATVRMATGGESRTKAHGPMKVWTKRRDGVSIALDGVGDGHLMNELTFSLLSVSQLCDHGCTVVFKPKNAFLLTARGEHVPLERDQGLYFLPDGESRRKGKSERKPDSKEGSDPQHAAYVSNHLPAEAAMLAHIHRAASRNQRDIKRTTQAIRRANYHPSTAERLQLDHHCMLATMDVRASQHRVLKYTMLLTRSQARAAKGSNRRQPSSTTTAASSSPRPAKTASSGKYRSKPARIAARRAKRAAAAAKNSAPRSSPRHSNSKASTRDTSKNGTAKSAKKN
jgi:hypothetical protein